MASALATEVPPNFKTSIGSGFTRNEKRKGDVGPWARQPIKPIGPRKDDMCSYTPVGVMVIMPVKKGIGKITVAVSGREEESKAVDMLVVFTISAGNI
ncbi:hypothetical protein GCM10011405_17860 [Rufibacter glacialis]|nr:hypothetical protein GCM10011405_17860 [Rufibacter glacialis]